MKWETHGGGVHPLGLWTPARSLSEQLGSQATPGEGRKVGPCQTLTQIVISLDRTLGCVKSWALIVKNGGLKQEAFTRRRIRRRRRRRGRRRRMRRRKKKKAASHSHFLRNSGTVVGLPRGWFKLCALAWLWKLTGQVIRPAQPEADLRCLPGGWLTPLALLLILAAQGTICPEADLSCSLALDLHCSPRGWLALLAQ